jgi:hypothetical protein
MAMPTLQSESSPPLVRVVGQYNHADFRDAIDLLHATATITTSATGLPELIVAAQSVPYAVSPGELQAIRREAPLAGIVGLMGTWCEGEMRTGRPWTGIERIYWYNFPGWWRRQLELRACSACPDWARGSDGIAGTLSRESDPRRNGLVVVATGTRETALAISDALQAAGYATVWQTLNGNRPVIQGAIAAIWDGGQLSHEEEVRLAEYCERQGRDNTPVIALLDFPRQDRCERARALGAAAVIGKPWLNSNLIAILNGVASILPVTCRRAA